MNQVSRSNAKSGASLMLLSATLMFLSGGVLAAPQAGDRVLGQWKDGYWYPATVKQIQGETVSLRFDDGATAQAAPNQLASLDWAKGTRVECNWKNGGKFYRGVISSRAQDRLAISYDDGDKEQTRLGSCRSKTASVLTFKTSAAETIQHRKSTQRKDENISFDEMLSKANNGNLAAQVNVGIAYLSGDRVAKNHNEGIRWLRNAADRGYAPAMHNLGFAYEKGIGVPKDAAEAFRWYQKSAEGGYMLAQNNLGSFYLNGTGVGKNDKEAVKWFMKSAEQGNTYAMTNLGDLYSRANNQGESLKWYRMAAEKGDAYAQFQVGHLLHDSDYPMAVAFYRKASEQGHQKATNAVQEARVWATEEAPNGNQKAIAVAKILGIRINISRKAGTSAARNENCSEVLAYDGFAGSKPEVRRQCGTTLTHSRAPERGRETSDSNFEMPTHGSGHYKSYDGTTFKGDKPCVDVGGGLVKCD